MTIKEAFVVGLAGLQVSSGLINRSILQAKITDSSSSYEPSLHDEMLEVATLNVLWAIWGTYKSISEGDMNISFSDDMLKKLLFLAKKHRRTDIVDALDDKPKIKRLNKW